MKKRIICGALIAALSLGAAAGAQAGLFRDVPDSHWAAGYIEEAAARGYVRGVGDGLYRPGQEVTYAEFAAMITRVLFPREQEKYEEGLRPWYAAYISICTVHGVFAGTGFQPGLRENEPMTRAELAVCAVNALESAGAKMPGREELEAVDVPDIALYPRQERAIRAVYALGVMNGSGDTGKFEGRDRMTRAQAAAVLTRMSRVELPSPESPDPEAVTRAVLAMKSRYPEGTPWTNENSYAWRGGIFTVGYGCMGFAFLLSDAAFSDLPARREEDTSLSGLRPGDILRLEGDTHAVIILTVEEDGVTVAEGNYNGAVHWGRRLTAQETARAEYKLTRY